MSIRGIHWSVPSLILSRRDLEFLLYEWLDIEQLTKRERFSDHSRDTFDAVLDLSEQLATKDFAPHNRKSDLNEPTFDGTTVRTIPEVKAALDAFAGTGLLAGTMDTSIGGMQLPMTVGGACFAWLQAANIATSAYAFLTLGNANLLLTHANQGQIDQFVRPMIDGRFLGTMCLSEPHAGSSLADVVTRAVPQGDGTYRVTGNKMWISGGDHELTENIIHLVLARVPGGPAGVKGLSLFIVPKILVNHDGSLGERNDVVLAGLNHKTGYRGTTNALLNFGEGAYTPGGSAGAVGYLVGEENRGLAAMFHMMNEARIAVGLGATALGYTGYLHSLDYAKSRPQGRPLTAKDADDPQIPIIKHTDVKRMLLAQKAYVEGSLAMNLYCGRLVDESQTGETDHDRDRAKLLLDVLTPIAKSWPSIWCLEANSLALQIHGGAGYTREYAVEQFWRDNRLNAIHEGTTGIQALDLLGRKAVMKDGAGLRLLVETIGETVARARALGGDAAEMADALEGRVMRSAAVVLTLWEGLDVDVALANATVYLEALGHVVVAWIWLEQVLAAHGKTGAFYDGKRQAARYFFRYELPKVDAQLALLESRDRTTLDMAESWF
jgi:alkylation response protein AidB-like acyl-CoA dehydrogenase